MNHECIVKFETRKIDNCSGEGHYKCYGTNPMIFEVWYENKDGIEEFCDGWIEIDVKFCPYCGLKKEDAP